MQVICRALLRWFGWKLGPHNGVELPKCVICVAPHTSNWDFVIGKLFYTSIGLTAGFLMKKDWFFFPLNLIFKSMGGIPVNRDKRTSLTDQVVEMFQTHDRFQVAITPLIFLCEYLQKRHLPEPRADRKPNSAES